MGFSKEMKDFIAAYDKGTQINARGSLQRHAEATTDALTKKTALENDPERIKLQDDQLRTNLDAARARIAQSQSAIGGQAVRNQYTQALIKRMQAADAQAGAVPAAGSGLLPPGMGGAQPPLQNTMQPDLYADGGLVEEEDEQPGVIDDLPDAAEAGAVPLSSATDLSAQRRRPQGAPPELGDPHIAVKEAYKYGTNAFGLPGTGAVRTAANTAKIKQLAAGAGALSPEEMEAARRTVDPEGKLPESQRNMAALGAVYQFWANKGEPEKAQKVAFQMLQHYRLASQRYAAIAAHAAEQGNVDLATKAALKAYANVPDGREIQITASPDGKLQYVYTDENGQTLSKGVATPEQLAASAMGLATGGFDRAILQAAGARDGGTEQGAVKAGKAPAKPGGGKALDENAASGLETALKGHQEKWVKTNKDATPDEEYWNGVRNAATHLQQTNPTATADEVVTAAKTLLSPSKKETEPFKTTDDGDGVSIKFKSGHRMRLDNDTFDVIMNQRAALLKQMQTQEDEAAKPAAPNKYAEGAKRIGKGVLDLGGEAGQAAGAIGGAIAGAARRAVPDELAERVGSDVGKFRDRILNPALDKFKNTGAIPGIDIQ